MLDQLGRADTDSRLGARIFDVVADLLIVRDTSALKDVLPRDYARSAQDKRRPGQLVDPTMTPVIGSRG